MHLGKCGINYSAGLNQKRYFLITSLKKNHVKSATNRAGNEIHCELI